MKTQNFALEEFIVEMLQADHPDQAQQPDENAPASEFELQMIQMIMNPCPLNGERPKLLEKKGTLFCCAYSEQNVPLTITEIGKTRAILCEDNVKGVRNWNQSTLTFPWSDAAIKKVGLDTKPYVLIESKTCAIVRIANNLEEINEVALLYMQEGFTEFEIMKLEGTKFDFVPKDVSDAAWYDFIEKKFPHLADEVRKKRCSDSN